MTRASQREDTGHAAPVRLLVRPALEHVAHAPDCTGVRHELQNLPPLRHSHDEGIVVVRYERENTLRFGVERLYRSRGFDVCRAGLAAMEPEE
jgi:hypothetical protein